MSHSSPSWSNQGNQNYSPIVLETYTNSLNNACPPPNDNCNSLGEGTTNHIYQMIDVNGNDVPQHTCLDITNPENYRTVVLGNFDGNIISCPIGSPGWSSQWNPYFSQIVLDTYLDNNIQRFTVGGQHISDNEIEEFTVGSQETVDYNQKVKNIKETVSNTRNTALEEYNQLVNTANTLLQDDTLDDYSNNQ